MELQFEKISLSCLRCLADETIRREETGEVRLPENMPDAACVISAWGQILLRGKEWRGGGMTVSGGVMAHVLYADEMGQMHCVDTWLPLQFKWEFPDPGRDGQICAWGALQGVDARVVNARKLMVRADVAICGKAWVKERLEIPQAGELPEDVQLLENTYPITLCREAGEQTFSLEEPLSPPDMEELFRCEVMPRITEQRVMGDKLVYRGVCKVHLLGLTNGKLHTFDEELPFSQFAELEEAYEQEAEGFLLPVVTALETERTEEGKHLLKCGLSCQYVICDREMLTLPEDAYSTDRELKPQTEKILIPAVLQMDNSNQTVTCAIDSDGLNVLEATMQASPGWLDRGENTYLLPLWSQVLYTDSEGKIRGESCRWEEQIPIPAGENVRPGIYAEAGELRAVPVGGKTEVSGTLYLKEMTGTNWEKEVVSGIELGEKAEKDPNRPSLILRRMGEEGLWEVAKSCGTTVTAIQNANNLTTEPTENTMLIIPIN
ncbi:MAG: DUF3794 domain-containing protein [Ruminococcaceae bacterium]|nr:DUF3794 domain-containing protein [Oscillospiraceae bacterium]